MNKIYKIVWSRTKHCYVVASEFAKGHTKSSSEKTSGAFKLGATLAAVALLGGIGVHSSVLAGIKYGDGSSAIGQTASLLVKELLHQVNKPLLLVDLMQELMLRKQ